MMDTPSSYLRNIVDNKHGITDMQVVFVDIEKYSKRRSLRQKYLIDAFSECLNKALTETAKEHIEYTQNNEINFQNDIIKLPSGDGAAIVFPFTGLEKFHLFFAETMLNTVNDMNTKESCNDFITKGWCDCHSNFNIRVGISAGQGIIYEDINNKWRRREGRILNLKYSG